MQCTFENKHWPVKQTSELTNKQVGRKVWELEKADTIIL
jgi:hypothetical protein